jgi:hypothetical protein
MYSTCLFCHAALGTNEAIEHFPVGRRLAFDAAKGRLWVVCRSCERWNLTPIEERWEAIEECERAFRNTKLRVSTDNVGLARLREGTTLIRIGEPQRPELAAWRYGDQFGRRRRQFVVRSTTIVAAAGGLILAGPLVGLASMSAVNLLNIGNFVRSMVGVARISVRGKQYRLNRYSLAHVELRPHELLGFELEVPHMWPYKTRMSLFAAGGARPFSQANQPSLILRGDEARQAARNLLPGINASGGSMTAVRDAVNLLDETPRSDDTFAAIAGLAPGPKRGLAWVRGHVRRFETPYTLSALPAAQRLALEMALHEDDERRALEGELAVLEERWKEAEEIAAISDDLFLPAGIAERLRRVTRG